MLLMPLVVVVVTTNPVRPGVVISGVITGHRGEMWRFHLRQPRDPSRVTDMSRSHHRILHHRDVIVPNSTSRSVIARPGARPNRDKRGPE
jgi:hypothetical protein